MDYKDLDDKDWFAIRHSPHEGSDNFEDSVVAFVNSQLEYFSVARLEREEIWQEMWAMYLGTPSAERFLRSEIYKSVGNPSNDWRHRINFGKAHELVETVVSHLYAATFPNEDWFDAVPLAAGDENITQVADDIRRFQKKKLHDACFKSYWDVFLRQLCITGFSVIALPWRFETAPFKKRVKVESPKFMEHGIIDYDKKTSFRTRTEKRITRNHPDFEVLDTFDVYVDPRAIDVESTDILRRIIKPRYEVAELIKSGYYKNMELLDLARHRRFVDSGSPGTAQTRKNRIKTFQGVNIEEGFNWNDDIEIFEYWGNIQASNKTYKDTVATVIGDKLVRFENNPFWCGKPFVLGTYTNIVRSAYAFGVLEPSRGLLHEYNLINNARLDNMELSINSMYEFVNDGSLQPEDIYSKPGRVFAVNQQGTINPIPLSNNFVISYDEANVLEQRIDKNAGTGLGISANAARDAERVTAQEISATRQAGGIRLTHVFKHIEETSLRQLLGKVFRLMQQFVTEDEVIRVPGKEAGEFEFVNVGQEELMFEFDIIPKGSGHVADKEYELNQRLRFLQIVSQNPDMAQHVDYFAFMLDLARKLDIHDVDQYIKDQTNPEPFAGGGGQAPPEEGLPPEAGQMLDDGASMVEGAQQNFGNASAQALQNNLQADGGQALSQEMGLGL